LLVWLGLLAYAFYNYAFYVFGAELNASFAVYVAALLLAGTSLVTALVRIEPAGMPPHRRVASRVLGGYLVFVATGLSAVWLALWAAYVFFGRPTPVEPAAFKVVAALDLSILVPSLLTGGVLLWRAHRWGMVAAAIASVQASVYLAVLAFNSVVAIGAGLVEPPGELPIWAPLAFLTTAAAAWLIADAGPRARL
jgi:hypothetical protein